MSALGQGLRACLRQEVEQRRLFPWLAVAYGFGIVLAFAADGPLSPWPPGIVAGVFAIAAVASRARLGALATMLAITATFAGFAVAVLRMNAVATPVLSAITTTKAGGFVEEVETRQAGARLVIRLTAAERIAEGERPYRVRVTTRAAPEVGPGDHVAGTMRLLPPPEAARPGGYDFARDAYFRRIGAVGSVSGRLARTAPPNPPDLGLRVAAAVDRARNTLTARIAGAIGGQPGAVAAALITGKRGLIDEHSNDVLRAAGIYHIVSISGLHMVLAAGLFFWLTRAFLALSPALALGWPIKKIAALAGMAGATAYDIFSGSDVATERSLFMILVMQGAILFDRPALSLRNLAISALIVLTREPETLLGPSLQMSYAAVAGLIALAEWHRRRRPPPREDGWLGRAWMWAVAAVIGTIATTIVATFATGPFSSYHFQNLQPYGIIGNAVTLPLVSLVVMPAAVIGVVMFPFGLDWPVWIVMGWAVSAVLALSEWVSGFAGSIVVVPAFGIGALALLVAAILCATLFVSRLRLVAAAPAALGLWLAATAPRPDIYVARDGSGAAIRSGDGRLAVVGRAPSFIAEQWLKADGDARKPGAADIRGAARCDTLGCVVERPAGAVAFVEDRRAFEQDCRRAAIVISRLSAPATCGASLAIDRAFLAAHGATAIRDGPQLRVETARRPGDTRPWLAQPHAPPVASALPQTRSPPHEPKTGTAESLRPSPVLPAPPDDAEPAEEPPEP